MVRDQDAELRAAGARLAASHAALAEALLPDREPVDAGAPDPSDDPAKSSRAAANAAANQGLLALLAGRALSPVARRHPWWLVTGAATLGAALVARPWRRAIGTALMAALLTPAARNWALREAARALSRPARQTPPSPPRSPP